MGNMGNHWSDIENFPSLSRSACTLSNFTNKLGTSHSLFTVIIPLERVIEMHNQTSYEEFNQADIFSPNFNSGFGGLSILPTRKIVSTGIKKIDTLNFLYFLFKYFFWHPFSLRGQKQCFRNTNDSLGHFCSNEVNFCSNEVRHNIRKPHLK